MLPFDVVIAFGIEVFVVIVVILLIMTVKKMPTCVKKSKATLPVCTAELCKQLEPLMMNYMKKVLGFDDSEDNLDKVKAQLKKQIREVHRPLGLRSPLGLRWAVSKAEGRQAMIQCIRTSLVKHPDDLRGRRRANAAREILINHVLEEGDCFFYLEKKFDSLASTCWNGLLYLSFGLPGCCVEKENCEKRANSAKKKLKAFCASAGIWLTIIWSAILWFLDVASDFGVLYAVWYCYKTIGEILEQQEEKGDLPELAQTVVEQCNLESIESVEKGLVILHNIFYKYFFQLSVILVLASWLQIVLALAWSQINWKAGSALPNCICKCNCINRSCNCSCIRTFCLNILSTPCSIVKNLVMPRLHLEDPEKEISDTDSNVYVEEMCRTRNRNIFKIVEAFNESLGACRIQLSFYFAFSYIVGTQEEFKHLDCIAQTLLGDSNSIFTIKKTGWHLMPILAFSAMMSLISITMAQYNLYTSRHEFDMSKMGKLFYLLSALMATFAKLATHVMFYTTILIGIIDPQNSGSQIFISNLPSIGVLYLQFQITSLVDWWMTRDNNGYSLKISTGYIWPTTSNTRLEMRRINAIRRGYLEFPPLNNCLQRTFKLMADRNFYWYVNYLFPWMGCSAHMRLENHPDQYGFEETVKSRNMYRKRFSQTIGLSSVLLCLQVVIAVIITIACDIDLTAQLATRNATYAWLSILPTQLVAMGLFFCFYEKFHVWKKEGVVVGWAYQDNAEFPLQTKFRGFWVSHHENIVRLSPDDSQPLLEENGTEQVALEMLGDGRNDTLAPELHDYEDGGAGQMVLEVETDGTVGAAQDDGAGQPSNAVQ